MKCRYLLLKFLRSILRKFIVWRGSRVGVRLNQNAPAWKVKWDMLIILDVCRYSTFSEAIHEPLGEYGLYFHPDLPLPELRIVPWFTVR